MIDRMRFVLMALAVLAAPARADEALADLGPAPEFVGVDAWLNSPPLTMAGLRGHVVLVDFWAYSCINCLRTLPFLIRWQHDYQDRGLVVVGVHAPEFKFEHDPQNVRKAIGRFQIDYPVALDNGMKTWDAFKNEYWPEEYLIDRHGRIVYKHAGEGNYGTTENAIQALLGGEHVAGPEPGADLTKIGSPEMYFGLDRVADLASPEAAAAGVRDYSAPTVLPLNKFALTGAWRLSGEQAVSARDGGGLVLHCRSGKVFMVASADMPVTLAVTVDGKAQTPVVVHESRLYTLFDSADYGEHEVRIGVPGAGFSAFTFTFG